MSSTCMAHHILKMNMVTTSMVRVFTPDSEPPRVAPSLSEPLRDLPSATERIRGVLNLSGPLERRRLRLSRGFPPLCDHFRLSTGAARNCVLCPRAVVLCPVFSAPAVLNPFYTRSCVLYCLLAAWYCIIYTMCPVSCIVYTRVLCPVLSTHAICILYCLHKLLCVL